MDAIANLVRMEQDWHNFHTGLMDAVAWLTTVPVEGSKELVSLGDCNIPPWHWAVICETVAYHTRDLFLDVYGHLKVTEIQGLDMNEMGYSVWIGAVYDSSIFADRFPESVADRLEDAITGHSWEDLFTAYADNGYTITSVDGDHTAKGKGTGLFITETATS